MIMEDLQMKNTLIAARKSILMLVVLLVWLPIGIAMAKDSVSIGMRLEPSPGLDPTTGAAAAISQVTLYNIFEGLTRLDGGGGVLPLLAKSWTISDDGTTYTFSLESGVVYHNGAPFNSVDVKAQFERNAAEDSSNKSKGLFSSIVSIATPDAHTVTVTLPSANALFPFFLAQAPAAILDYEAYADANTNPVGTGPYQFVKWTKGDSVTLKKFDKYRNAGDVQIANVQFRFISDAAAQVAALKAGDLDYMPSLSAPEMFAEFQKADRFTTLRGTTES